MKGSATIEVLVVGAGSIGTRHVANLARAGATVTVTDPVEGQACATGAARVVPFHLDNFDGYDAVVVASPSSCHAEQATAALATGAHVLVEKPLATTAEDAAAVAAAGDGRLMVGYNLRLHRPVERLMELAHSGRAGPVRGARLWFGSYLPDWRPAAEYRSGYSARSELGGGVLMDAIHELDLLLWLLDERLEVAGAAVERTGILDIDVEDTVKAVLRHADGAVVDVSLDYLSRRYRRGIEVVGDLATLRLDWARGVIEVEDADDVVTEEAATPVGVSYEREAELLLAWVRGECLPPVDGPTGAASVLLADAIRHAARGSHP